MSRQNTNGNTIAEGQEYVRHAVRQWERLLLWERLIRSSNPDDFVLKDVRLKAPLHEGDDWLAIVRAFVDGVAVVGFVSGDTVIGCLMSTAEKIMNNSVKWKDDEYAQR